MDFEMSKTKENLARAFAGECQAGARYQFVATMAKEQDFAYLQTMLKTLAKHEMSHAKIFWDLIAKYTKGDCSNIEIKAGYPFKSGTLQQMLLSSANNEKSENSSIYPAFAKVAEDEGFMDVAEKFKQIALVENDHFMILDELYNKFKSDCAYCDTNEVEWKCNQCGYTKVQKKCFSPCPLCQFPQGSTIIPLKCKCSC